MGGIDSELLGPATEFASLVGALQGSRGKGDEDGQEQGHLRQRHRSFRAEKAFRAQREFRVRIRSSPAAVGAWGGSTS